MTLRALCFTIAAAAGSAGFLAQQPPAFEAASVKPAASGVGPSRFVSWLSGGRMTATGLTLRELVRSAYVDDGIQLVAQVVDGPSWVDTARFDILAKENAAPAGDANDIRRQHNAMLRSLLADRFKLRVHMATRELPVFDLVLADKPGQRAQNLKTSTCDPHGAPGAPDADRPRPCVWAHLIRMDPNVGITMGYDGRTMAAFAAALVTFPEIDRPVRDRTRLAGAFDMQMTLPIPPAPGQPAVGDVNGAPSDSGIFTALQEQLGMRLESRRDQADVIVIDSVEPPAPD